MKSRFQPWHIGVAVALITLLVFGESIGHDWVAWDDQENVYRNPWMNPPRGESFARFWSGPYFSLYMPVTYSFWTLLAYVAALPNPVMTDGTGVYSLNPQMFHAASVLLHVINTLLIFVLLRRWADDIPAGLGALLFGIHPVQVEPVVWVTGMNNVLSATFGLLALTQYLKWAQGQGASEKTRSSPRHYVVALICCVLALLAKPTAVALPLLVWALDHWAIKRPAQKVTFSLLPWLGAAVLCVLLTRNAQVPGGTPVHSPLWARPLLVTDSLAFYTLKTALPLQLGIDYGRTPDFVLNQAVRGGVLYWLVPIVLTIVAWRARMARPLLWVSWAIFCLALLPTSGLVPFYFHEISLVADRYLYLALLGPALAVSVLLTKYGARAQLSMAALLLICGVWSVFTSLSWSNSFTLFEQALAVNPRSWVAHTNYGDVLSRRGDVSGATQQFRAALEIHPSFAPARYNLGVLLLKQGDKAAARAQWTSLLQEHPDYAPARRALDNLSRE